MNQAAGTMANWLVGTSVFTGVGNLSYPAVTVYRTVHSLAVLLSRFDCHLIAVSTPQFSLPEAVEVTVRQNFQTQVRQETDASQLLRWVPGGGLCGDCLRMPIKKECAPPWTDAE